MVTKEVGKTTDLMESTEHQGVEKVLRSQFQELMSIGSSAERNVCRLYRDFLMSTLGLDYFSKLNLLVKKGLVATTDESRRDICQWIDRDVMGAIDALCEAGVFETPRTLSALADIVLALYSSLSVIDEDEMEDDIDYLFDLPYRLNEMAIESPRIPTFYMSSLRHEERGWSKQVSVHISEGEMKLSYRAGVER